MLHIKQPTPIKVRLSKHLYFPYVLIDINYTVLEKTELQCSDMRFSRG